MATIIDVGAVLLDMDGTLVDSEAVSDRCWTAWCRQRDKDLDHLLTLSRGRQVLETMRVVAPELDEGDLAVDAETFLRHELEDTSGIVATPGAAALLDRLAQLRVPHALVTSAARPVATARMTAAGLTLPAVAVCAEDVSRGKPAPDGYRRAAESLGVPSRRCVVVEDALSGVEAGQAAGARVIGIGVALAGLVDDWTTSPAGLTVRRRRGARGATVTIGDPADAPTG